MVWQWSIYDFSMYAMILCYAIVGILGKGALISLFAGEGDGWRRHWKIRVVIVAFLLGMLFMVIAMTMGDMPNATLE